MKSSQLSLLPCTLCLLLITLALSGCQAEPVNEIARRCGQKDTVLCKDGKVNPDIFIFEQPVKKECLVDAFFKDITETKMRSITEWMESCQSLEYRKSGFRPISKQVEKQVFSCSIDGETILIDEYTPHSTANYTLKNCQEGKMMVSEPLSPCVEKHVDVCGDSGPDMTVVDPRVRKDCGAMQKRSELWQDLAQGYNDWLSQCNAGPKGGRRELDYQNNCGTWNLIRFNQMNLFHLKFSAGSFYHWHFHNLRGALSTPLVAGTGIKQCWSSTCTAKNYWSCWPRPWQTSNFDWATYNIKLYRCTGQDQAKLHISGSFSGFLTIPGTVQPLSSNNDCEVTSTDGIVKVNPIGTQWCDVWIKNLAGDGITFELGQDLRNFCDGI